MKINIIPTLIAVIASVLFAYLFYSISNAEEKMLNTLAVSSFISFVTCIECGIGISFKDKHHTVNGFAASALFFVLFLVDHCCFAIWGTNPTWVIITTGLLLVMFLLVYYGISKAKM